MGGGLAGVKEITGKIVRFATELSEIFFCEAQHHAEIRSGGGASDANGTIKAIILTVLQKPACRLRAIHEEIRICRMGKHSVFYADQTKAVLREQHGYIIQSFAASVL